MEQDEQADPGGPGDLCDKCYAPLDAKRTWTCVFGDGCCPDCFAACEAAGRCAKFSDEFWEGLERVMRRVRAGREEFFAGPRRDG